MASLSVLIPVATEKKKSNVCCFLVSGKETVIKKLKHDIKRVTVLKNVITAHVDSCNT